MCKILNIAGINNGTKDAAWKFIHEMGKEMSKNNDDGLGYTAIDKDGDMFGERWLHNNEAFKTRTALSELDKKLIESYNGCINKEDKYNSFGNLNESIVAITLHTRMATSGKQFYNTHPFVLDDVSLIHNGVIRNTTSLINTMSTCDSECILHEYVDNDVSSDVKNFQKVVDKLEGYFALGVLGYNQVGYYLDIIKDNKASLYAAYIEQLGTVVFTTDISDVYKVCKKLKYKVVSHYEVIDNVLLRLDVVTGKAFNSFIFKPKPTVYSSTNTMNDYVGKYDDMVKANKETNRPLTYDDITHIQDWERTGSGTWKKVIKG